VEANLVDVRTGRVLPHATLVVRDGKIAELLRLEKSAGALEPGLDADVISVQGNPLENPAAREDVLLVVSNGFVALDRLSFSKSASAARPAAP
jgi:imidazolonepropionase-like amidohydrolase